MEYYFRFGNIVALWYLLPIIVLLMALRYFLMSSSTYNFSLTHYLVAKGYVRSHPAHAFFYALRFCTLLALSLLIARPQWVDSSSHVKVEGIDMVLTLDVSGSMKLTDMPNDNRSRFAIAKHEASRFIDKRINDSFGLVIFANDAMSLCPLTIDKSLLREVINDLHVGFLDENGTKLARGLLTAASRLRHSDAKSKVIILLTDGDPSPDNVSVEDALRVVKELGIKVYTVGIGGSEDVSLQHFYAIPGVNKKLLDYIAQQTGGSSFMAHSANDMRSIYQTIDTLERTKHDVRLFGNYHDIYLLPVVLLLMLLLLEWFLATFVWFII